MDYNDLKMLKKSPDARTYGQAPKIGTQTCGQMPKTGACTCGWAPI